MLLQFFRELCLKIWDSSSQSSSDVSIYSDSFHWPDFRVSSTMWQLSFLGLIF